MYASHVDSCIYAYYAGLLQKHYEEELTARGIVDVPIAYRRLDGKCNIDFAFEVFDHIRRSDGGVAIAADISDFFGSMTHAKLKVQWQKLFGEDRLPPDHYAIFKSVTEYAFVDRDEVFMSLGVSKTQQRNWHQPFCSIDKFRDIIRKQGLVHKNPALRGIPQGSPISALLSNIYMLDFDVEIKREAEARGAYYRRYSDDILLFCKSGDESFFIKLLHDQMGKYDLTYSEGKEQVSVFTTHKGGLIANKPLQYLGFLFDGQRNLIRDRTVQRQKQKAKKAVRSAIRAARKAGAKIIYRRKIYSQHSHLPDLRKHKESKYGNFYSYVRRCDKQGEVSKSIRRQMKSHWEWLDRLIVESEKEL